MIDAAEDVLEPESDEPQRCLMPPRIGTLLLLILPGAGFIALFLGIALGMVLVNRR